jgi:hypothetical protein
MLTKVRKVEQWAVSEARSEYKRFTSYLFSHLMKSIIIESLVEEEE